MRILRDLQTFSFQRYGGISRYFCEIDTIFSQKRVLDAVCPFGISDNYYLLRSHHRCKIFNITGIPSFKGKTQIVWSANKFLSLPSFKPSSFDVFHPTFFDPYFIDRIEHKPCVVTVYDMIHEIYPSLFRSNDPTASHKKRSVGRANRLICISENTKKDLMRHLSVSADKIDVVPLGTSFHKVGSSPLPVPERFILFVGERVAYKNFAAFLRAVEPSLKKTSIVLICVGGGTFRPDENRLIQSLGLEKLVFRKDATDAQLKFLYQSALLFVFPSLYEGFGIPILEAFCSDCPVALSKASCFEEVAGEAGIYFDPHSEDSMRNTIEKAIHPLFDRQKYIHLGGLISKKFCWEATAKKTLECYQKAL